MKKITGLVVIVAALVLGSYYGMGYLTEKKVREDLIALNQSNGLSAEIKKYNRGLFKSNALVDWHLAVPERVSTLPNGQTQTLPAENYEMQMPLVIHHGPVIFANKKVKFGLGYAQTDLTLPAKYSEKFNKVFSGASTQPKLDLSMFVSYLNNTNVDAKVPAFKLIANEGNGQLDWTGMTSATTISSDLGKINGDVTIDGLNVIKEPMNTVISAITGKYSLHKSETGMYLGDASLSFPSLVITNANKKIFELNQFNVNSDTNIEKGLFSSHFKSSLDKVVAHDKTYGPGSLGMAIRNLDAAILAKLNEQINQIQQSTDSDRQKILLAMLPELPKLFSQGPEFEITEMNLVMPQGNIEGHMLVALPKTDSANPFELIQKIQGNGKLKVPTVVLKDILTESIRQALSAPQPPKTINDSIVQQMQQQNSGKAILTTNQPATQPTVPATPAEIALQAAATADKQLLSMLQSGLLTQQGNDYVVELTLNQGQLVVNGKPFNPAMLKFQ